MSLFPLFVKLESRPCLVVGAGSVGESKIQSLLDAGAAVRVVAPQATETVAALAAAGRISWQARGFEPCDLEGIFLAIAATSSRELNESVFHEAQRRGVLCNVVDDPPHCDFYYPSVVRRGDLQIAISTNGKSPALAQRLRHELEQQFGPEYGSWLDHLGEAREQLFSQSMDPELRRRRLHALASRNGFEAFLRQGFERGAQPPGLEDSSPTIRDSRSSADKSQPAIHRHPPTEGADTPATRKVYLVGAGPGDPELLTVKARRILSQADVVLHDDLVAPAVLGLASPAARVVNVGKRCGHKKISQEQINSLLVSQARQGLTVVRLKGGDPQIFGRAGEEIEALQKAGIGFEIVPGVTAALAAAAGAGIPLTDRRRASSVLFLTGHRCARNSGHYGKLHSSWPASIPPDTTVVLYMPGDDYASVARELRAIGLDGQTPCLLVSQASTEEEQTYHTVLDDLTHAPQFASPKLLIIGAVAAVSDPTVIRDAIESSLSETEALLAETL